MTLRARLMVLAAMIVAVVTTIGILVVDRQREVLVRGLDEVLLSAPVPAETSADPVLPQVVVGDPPGSSSGSSAIGRTVQPASDLYVAVLRLDGVMTAEIPGQLLSDRPDLGSIDLAAIDRDVFVSASGVRTDERFRVLVRWQGNGSVGVVATPLSPVDSAVGTLIWSLVVAGLAIAVLLFILVWWVLRLALRPIRQLTEATTAAKAGVRAPRVEPLAARSEAGRLAAAFNEMLDQRDRADARLRRFVADASHELRTPLTSMEGYLELFAHDGIDPVESREMVRRLRKESHRMRDLVEDLLLLAHLDEGRPLRRDLIDLAAIVRDLAADAAVMHPERHIEVVIDGADAPGGDDLVQGHQAHGDELRLHQVIAGLLGNALVHTPATAAIELRVGTDDSGASVITVRDEGPGLDAPAAATVFDRFARGDSSRSRPGDHAGFGLGLAIARSIVEAHGGRLTLATAPGAGCNFTIVLPRTEPSAA